MKKILLTAALIPMFAIAKNFDDGQMEFGTEEISAQCGMTFQGTNTGGLGLENDFTKTPVTIQVFDNTDPTNVEVSFTLTNTTAAALETKSKLKTPNKTYKFTGLDNSFTDFFQQGQPQDIHAATSLNAAQLPGNEVAKIYVTATVICD